MSWCKFLFAVSALAMTGVLWAEEQHHMLIFASQAEPKLPRTSHSFALFVKASPDSSKLESQCISWMPKSLVIDAARLHPTDGANLNLAETLKWVRSVNGRVSLWGPYPIRTELYDLAVHQAERLNAGTMRYVTFDRRNRGKDAFNCIHAVCDLDDTQPLLDTGANFGDDTGELFVGHFRRYITPSDESTRWLTERLRLSPSDIRFVGASLPVVER
jgi:hypothetical protein